MYEAYFNFATAPFRLNPDPKFFFGSRSHNKAMAYLHYGLRQGEGFIVITGEIGAGKSILIGHLIDQLDRSNVVAAHLLTTNVEPSALLSHVLSAFRIEPAGTGKSAEIEAFEDFLFDQMNRGRRVLLIVDEAQNLPAATIEELRMLSNMDYDGTPLFQVFLVGQPEFRSVLARPEMEQFRQRVIASYHLEPLGLEETTEYIRHRLQLVGWTGANPSISDDAFEAIHRATGGVPRKINKLCNRLLLHCSIEERSAIDAGVVLNVEADLKTETVEQAGAEATASADDKPADEKTPEPKAITASEPEQVQEQREAIEQKAAAAGQSGQVVIPFGAARKRGGAEDNEDVKEKPGPLEKQEGATGQADEPAPTETEKAPGVANTPATPAAEDEKAARPARQAEPAAMPPSPPAPRPKNGTTSVLDRLRAHRKAEAELFERERAPATLIDVANAIAAASAANEANRVRRAAEEVTEAAETPDQDEPVFAVDPRGWRQSVLKSIEETREELKSAHGGVAKLRQKFAAHEERRQEARAATLSHLERAESLLAELRQAWR